MNLRPLLYACAAASALALSSCQKMTEPYAPPEQRQPIETVRNYHITRVVNMDDGDATSHFVRDIRDLNGNWRWTGKRPALKILVRDPDKLHYVMDFTIPGVTFDVTGPVTMSFYVNDHLVDTVHYAAPGKQHFDKAIPADWVQANTDATIAAEIDKVWVSPDGATQLGFILERAGLKQED